MTDSLFSAVELATAGRAGYRLQHVEVFNWGTFDRRVWRLSPHGETSLLTGDIGSGKSTILRLIGGLYGLLHVPALPQLRTDGTVQLRRGALQVGAHRSHGRLTPDRAARPERVLRRARRVRQRRLRRDRHARAGLPPEGPHRSTRPLLRHFHDRAHDRDRLRRLRRRPRRLDRPPPWRRADRRAAEPAGDGVGGDGAGGAGGGGVAQAPRAATIATKRAARLVIGLRATTSAA